MEEVGEWGENSIWKNPPLAMEVDLFMFDIAHAMYISMHIDKDYSIIAQKQVLLY